MIQKMQKRAIYAYVAGIAVLFIVDLQAGSCISTQKNKAKVAPTAGEAAIVNNLTNVGTTLAMAANQPLSNAKRPEDLTVDELMHLNTVFIGIIDHSKDQSYFKTLTPFPTVRATLDNMYGNFKNMTEEEKKEWEPKIKSSIILSNEKLAEFINKSLFPWIYNK